MSNVQIVDGVALDPVTFAYSQESSAVRLVVILNGYAGIGISAQCTSNAHGFNDLADVVIPIDRDLSVELADAATAIAGGNPSPSVTVEVWAGLAETPQYGSTSLSGLQRIFLGVVDSYEASGVLATATLHCRGAAANLADLKLTQIALGRTSIDFGKIQAAAAGLKFESNLQLTPVTIQQVLGKEFVGGSTLQTTIYRKSAADLLKESATFDDADVWVEDDTIHYERASMVNRGPSIAIRHGRDTIVGDAGLQLSHALRFSKNVRVDVHGSQPRTRLSSRTTLVFDPVTGVVRKVSSVTKMSRSTVIYGTNETMSQAVGGTSFGVTSSTGGNAASSQVEESASNVERYRFFVPNADAATCNRLATALARQIAALEYSVSFTVPMTRRMLALRIVTPIALSGVVLSAFNDTYYPRQIVNNVSLETGWHVTVRAVNHTLLQGELD